ncbi:MAG: hypothetical protein R2827_06280 [Bdellovibrionales bacterium]
MFRFKRVLLIVCLFSFNHVFASTNSVTEFNSEVVTEKSSVAFEGGLVNSAVNEGTTSISLGFVGDLAQWFSLGVRGNIPIYNAMKSQAMVYSVQGVARINFVNNLDNIFLETFVSFNSGKKEDVNDGSSGVGLGYLRDLGNDYKAGLNIGTHFAEIGPIDGEVTLIVKRGLLTYK